MPYAFYFHNFSGVIPSNCLSMVFSLVMLDSCNSNKNTHHQSSAPNPTEPECTAKFKTQTWLESKALCCIAYLLSDILADRDADDMHRQREKSLNKQH